MDTLYLTVTDNGSGIEPDTLDALRQHISGAKPSAVFGIALQNVHKQLQLLFGGTYGLSIDSKPSSGTKITVTLPALPHCGKIF